MAKVLVSLVVSVSALAIVATSSKSKEPERFDVIVRHGMVIDGTGARAYAADVGIRGGYIAEIGDLSSATATKDVEARGLFVTPGFINVHDHSTTDGIRRADNMLTQGVTLGIGNADGGGATDLNKEAAEFSANGMAMNLAFSIGFNSVWAEAMGPSDRRATPADIAKMQALILAGLRSGAAGVSAGLDYKPAYFSTPAEGMRVLAAARDWRTFFPNHDRVAPPDYSSYKGMGETIALASSARIMPEITHIKIQGHEQGSAAAVIRMMDEAAAKGHYVAADIYPYLAGNTGLANVIVPGWAQDGGRAEMLKRFAQPDVRRRIALESEDAMKARLAGGPAGIYIPSMKREFTDIMREEQAGPGETLIRVLEKNNPGAILRFGVESDMTALLKYPSTSITCDCGASVTGRGGGHPRGFGSYPRILGVYVRDRGVLTWEDAIRKMSGLPASTMGVVDRGFISVGMRADVTVFDPKTIRDVATYEAPNEPSVGVRYVLVNGQIALADGKPTGIQSGQIVRLSTHMPSRPMANVGARWLLSRSTFDSPLGKVNLLLELKQTVSSREAAGRAQIRIGTGGWSLDVTRLGILQVSHKWASFTGWGRTRDGREEPVTVILDAEGPGTPKGKIVLSVMTPDKSIEASAPVAGVRMNDIAAYR